MADLKLEYKDIKTLLPLITEDVARALRDEFEQEEFIPFPEGLQKFLFGEANKATYMRVWRLWNQPSFPRVLHPKGVYLKDLKEWQTKTTSKNNHK